MLIEILFPFSILAFVFCFILYHCKTKAIQESILVEVIDDYSKFRIHLDQLKLPSKIKRIGTDMFASGCPFGKEYRKNQNVYLEGDYLIFCWEPDRIFLSCENEDDNYIMWVHKNNFMREREGFFGFTEYYVDMNGESLHYTKYVPRYHYPVKVNMEKE